MTSDPSFFSHLMVLISIILGFAITEIFTSVGAILRNRKSIVFSYAPLMWVFVVCLSIVQFWWAMWSFSEVGTEFGPYALLIFITTVNYLLTKIILPNFASADVVGELTSGTYSLESYYLRNVSWMSGMAVLLVVLSVVNEVSHFGTCAGSMFRAKLPMRLLFVFLLVVMGITGYVRKRELEKDVSAKPSSYGFNKRTRIIHNACTSLFAVTFCLYIRVHASDAPKEPRHRDCTADRVVVGDGSFRVAMPVGDPIRVELPPGPHAPLGPA